MSDERCGPESYKHIKKAGQFISLEKRMEVIRREENGQTLLNVCISLNLPSSSVTTIMRNADKHSDQ